MLAAHPAVADVACIGVPHPDLGEPLLALVVPADLAAPPPAAALLAHCRDNLTLYKCPRAVEIVDSIPRSAVGKLDKRALRAPYWPAAGAMQVPSRAAQPGRTGRWRW